MAHLVLVRPVHFPPGREETGLAWMREAMAARTRAGMLRHAIMRSRTDPRDYVALMVWPDEASYRAWNESDERKRLFGEGPHYMARERTRRYELLQEPSRDA